MKGINTIVLLYSFSKITRPAVPLPSKVLTKTRCFYNRLNTDFFNPFRYNFLQRPSLKDDRWTEAILGGKACGRHSTVKSLVNPRRCFLPESADETGKQTQCHTSSVVIYRYK